MPTTVRRIRTRQAVSSAESSTLAELEDVDSLAALFKIEQWDAIVVGDGSGTTRDKPCGWGAVMIESDDREQRTFSGGFCSGTNNMAEIMAVLQPLMDLTSRKRGMKSNGLTVHVFSDSEYVVSGLNRGSALLQASTSFANRELWLALYGTRRNGLVITAHHVPRDTLYLQKVCHELANKARLAFVEP